MKIIIAGAGKIGEELAKILAGEKHEVTVIDNSSEVISRVSNTADVICIQGSATSSGVLREAGAESADLLIAATEADEMNMVCGISASRLGTKHVIARIRDTEYLNQRDFLREMLGLSVIINPEYECAREISRILRFPGACRVDTFTNGSAEIVEYLVRPGSPIAGKKLKELPSLFKGRILMSLVERDDEAIIPRGDFELREGDRVSIMGNEKQVRKFFVSTGEYKKPVKNVIIMGGGRIAEYLAVMLDRDGIDASIIEIDRQLCEELCDRLPRTHIVCGDATSSEVLLEEGLRSADGFAALTGDDGDNILTSIYARSIGVEKTVTKVNREHYADIIDDERLDSLVNTRDIIAQQITRYVRAMEDSGEGGVRALYRLADGKAEALEFVAGRDSKITGIPLKELKLKKDVLVALVTRGSWSSVPGGDTVIQPGDHAVIVAAAGCVKELDEIIEGA